MKRRIYRRANGTSKVLMFLLGGVIARGACLIASIGGFELQGWRGRGGCIRRDQNCERWQVVTPTHLQVHVPKVSVGAVLLCC